MPNKTVQCVVVTPERTVLDQAVDFVAVPMYDGELGVLPGRAPLIGRLGFGELRTKSGNETGSFYIDGGFIQVRSDEVTVLTSKAQPAKDINIEQAKQNLAGAQKLEESTRARAMLRVARKAAPPS